MSRQNTVEIIVKVKDATGGFDSSKRRVKKFAEDVKKDLNDIEAHGGKVGKATGKKISDETVKAAKGTGEKVGKEIAKGIEKHAGGGSGGKASAQKAGLSFGSSFMSGVSKGFDMVPLPSPWMAAAAPAAGAALTVGGAAMGGLALAGTAAGAVGLGAFLLKDNEKVSNAWEKTFDKIGADSKKAAGVLEDEFVGAAKQTADIWAKDVKPAVEGIFIEAQPLVEKFTTGLGKAVADFLPGIKTAVANSGPAVEGFGDMMGSILKGAGDGMAELSKHSDNLGKSLKIVGDGIGGAIEKGLKGLGDLSDTVVDNEDDFRRWGDNVGQFFDGAILGARNLAELLNSIGGDGKDDGGDTFLENLKKFALGREPGDADIGLSPSHTNDAEEMKKNIDQITTSMGFLNTQKDLGIKLTAADIEKTSQLIPAQKSLVETGLLYEQQSKNSAAADKDFLATAVNIASQGYQVHDSLMNVVAGMSDAELAAIGATVTTDALGQSVISIPGHKPITLTADAAKANPPIDGVISRLGQVQDKNVAIRVTTHYSVIGNATSGANMASLSRPIASNKGGLIPGGGPDRDSVHAFLTPGEFVVNRKATQANRGLLERLNEASGGSATFAMPTGGSGYSSGGGGGGGGTTIRIEWGGGPADDFGRQVWSWLQRNVRVRGGNTSVLP